MRPHLRQPAGTVAAALPAVIAVAFWLPWLVGAKVPAPGDQQSWMLPWAAAADRVREPVQWQAWWWDGVAQFYPWRAKLHRELSRGQWPLWNEQQFCGYPFVGNGQSAMFYPPNWIYAVLHPSRGMAVSAALHCAVAGTLMLWFCLALGIGVWGGAAAGIAYALGGPMSGLVPLPTMTNAAAWLPGCLLGVELVLRADRSSQSLPAVVRGVAVLAACVAMTVLAGHLQIAAYVLLATAVHAVARLVVRVVARRPVRVECLLAAVLVGVLAASAQLLPSLELGGLSARGAGAASSEGFAFHRQFALQAAELLTFVLPEALGHPARGDYALFSYGERTGFLGVTALLLALAGIALWRRRTRWALAGGATLVLWAAMGGLPALVMYYGVPKVGLAGGFVRLLFLYTFCVAVLAGMGLDRIIRLGATVPSRPVPLRALAGLALAGLCIELCLWAWRTVPCVPSSRMYPDTAATRLLQEQARPGDRLLAVTPRSSWSLMSRPDAVFPPNSASAYEGIESVQGYDSLFPANYLAFAGEVEEGQIPSPPANGNMVLLENADSALLRLAGVRWVMTRSGEPGDGDALEMDGVRLERRDDALPRAFQTPLPVTDSRRGAAMLRRLAGSDVRALEYVAQGGGAARIEGLDGTGHQVVVTNTYYPGWRAWQGSTPVPIRPVAGIFQAIAPRPGAGDRVLVAYCPSTVAVGQFLYLLAAGTLAGLLAFESCIRRRRRSRL